LGTSDAQPPDRSELGKALGLKHDREIVLAQTLGYPAG
jgi:hypothetical protein